LVVPAELVAEMRKWYSVLAAKPEAIAAETCTGLEPEPGSVEHEALES
jgi:hypothetical protein